MLVPTLFLLGLGFIAAVVLSIASRIFYVWEDPKIEEVQDALLGANCGGCGYPGCSAAAIAVVAGKAGADVCVAGGTNVAMKVAGVMGVEVEIKEPEISHSSCHYGVAEADTKFIYSGINDCRAAILYDGGPKVCPIGCIGLGTCSRACPFGAITMGDQGLPVFDRNRCRSCGVCVEICPKNIIYLTSTTNRMIGDFRTDECTTPCQRRCPTGIDIPSYISEITRGNYRESVRIIKEKNPFPLIIGRICPAPCELDCRRNFVEEPVAINHLKRFVADYEMQTGERVLPFKAPDTEHNVAVIGGGTQGLTTAYYLACLGHHPTVFEAMPKLGGIIRNVIPKSRLPEEIMDWEIEGVLSAGVKAETNKVLGRDFTVNSLLDDGYKAVVFSTGGIDSRKILRGSIELEQTIPGVYTLIDFLINSSRGNRLDIGENVYIIGAGNSTLEAASICLKNGAKEVSIIYPYSREDLISRNIDTEKTEQEGVIFLFSTVISKLIGEGDRLTGIEISKPDGDRVELPADTLIVATGRLSDIVFVRSNDVAEEDGEPVQQSNRWETIESYKMFSDNNSNDIFNLSENSIINDNLAVVKSIGRGRKITRAVHLFLTGKDLEAQVNLIKKGTAILNTEDILNVAEDRRNAMPQRTSVSSYCSNDMFYCQDEIDTGYTEEMAKKEALRCLDCGLICYKKSVS
jgi:formate dehydrogenase beta subunit